MRKNLRATNELVKYFKPHRKPVAAVAEGMTYTQLSQRGLGCERDSVWAMSTHAVHNEFE